MDDDPPASLMKRPGQRHALPVAVLVYTRPS